MRNLIFTINGGIGKCIVATSVCSALKKKYPNDNLIVVSGYPEVFINNPNVFKSFSFSNVPYFYLDYIDNKDILTFLHDPYLTKDFIKGNKHLSEIWCDLFGVKYQGEQPEIFLTQREIDFYQRQIVADKPILLMQTNGGGDTNKKYSWARDIPQSVVLKVIEEFKNDYSILHVRRQDQIAYKDTTSLTGELRQILCVALLSKKRLVMDSFLQHALGGLNLPSVACWIANSPKVLGYDIHTDILPNEFTKKPELRKSFLHKFNIGGDELEFPYNSENEIFDVDKIVKALKNENILPK